MPISMPIALGNMTTAAMPIASASDVASATKNERSGRHPYGQRVRAKAKQESAQSSRR